MARAWTDRGLLSLEAEAFEEEEGEKEMVVAEDEAAQAHGASPSRSLSLPLSPSLSPPLSPALHTECLGFLPFSLPSTVIVSPEPR
jgi:hypothetical protein